MMGRCHWMPTSGQHFQFLHLPPVSLSPFHTVCHMIRYDMMSHHTNVATDSFQTTGGFSASLRYILCHVIWLNDDPPLPMVIWIYRSPSNMPSWILQLQVYHVASYQVISCLVWKNLSTNIFKLPFFFSSLSSVNGPLQFALLVQHKHCSHLTWLKSSLSILWTTEPHLSQGSRQESQYVWNSLRTQETVGLHPQSCDSKKLKSITMVALLFVSFNWVSNSSIFLATQFY